MTEQKIIFTPSRSYLNIPKDFYPIPSSKIVPEWYKNMPTTLSSNHQEPRDVSATQTVKRCMPVFDVMTAGYILLTPTDVYVKRENGVIDYEWPINLETVITPSPAFQLVNYRNLHLPQGVGKFENPWGIKTSKGYSCLFINPTHRPISGIKILEGIVDTDSYNAPVHFPFLVDDNFQGTIPAGTPLAQVIPFKRDSFKMELGDSKQLEENEKQNWLINSSWINVYRRKFRANKNYL